jgi:hypothetical protein
LDPEAARAARQNHDLLVEVIAPILLLRGTPETGCAALSVVLDLLCRHIEQKKTHHVVTTPKPHIS